ncbi:MAG: FAD-binding oxidoreductase [Actinomycetota bacterium]
MKTERGPSRASGSALASTRTKIASWSFTLPTSTDLLRYDGDDLRWSQRPEPVIPRGAGRSYGDAAYVTGGVTLASSRLRRILDLDDETGTIRCEAGVEMGALHRFLEETDWSFPIFGGTQWATLGGATASDIHGKNHVADGSFGHHVAELEIVLGSGDTVLCSPEVNADLFRATIGGMGLTGFVKSVTLRLQPARSSVVRMRSSTVKGVPAFVDALMGSDDRFQFVSCVKPGTPATDVAIHPRANHAEPEGPVPSAREPIEVPLPTLRFKRLQLMHVGMSGFRRVQLRMYGNTDKLTHVRDYNYIGLHEVIKNVNHLLGSFIEYQFVVPAGDVQAAWSELIRMADRRRVTCRGYVFKRLGPMPGVGLLSFPAEGVTASMFAPDTVPTRRLFRDFTDALIEMGGRVYLAKDSCISARQLEAMYGDQLDAWRSIVSSYDPGNRVRSDMSRRLAMKPW